MSEYRKNVPTAILVACLAVFSTGCDFFNRIVGEIIDSGGFSTTTVYRVSTVDLKVVKTKDSPLVVSSSLASKLKKAVHAGVEEAQETEKGKNLNLTNSIPKTEWPKFYQFVMEKNLSFDKRMEYLKNTSDKYNTNMVIWGMYAGDDIEITVLCFLYRRDVHRISVALPVVFTSKESELRQCEIVRDVVHELVEKSLPHGPIIEKEDIGRQKAQEFNDYIQRNSKTLKVVIPLIIMGGFEILRNLGGGSE